jgi:N6-adenosine-specific RNA methylase IME4
VRVDEAKSIRDAAVALRVYAKQANNRDAEANAVELRLRATRRLGDLIDAQRQTVGLSEGTRGSKVRGARVDGKPTLSQAGINKNLAHDARTLRALSEERFEETINDARDRVMRASRNAVREVQIAQEREQYRARTERGATVADLEALVSVGKRFGVVYADPAWPFDAYSGKGKQRSAERHYDTESIERTQALPVQALAADDCALLLWAVWPRLDDALDVIRAWGFAYQTCGFLWVKQNPSGEGLYMGMGYHTRANSEPCLLATRGSPRRLANDVRQVVLDPVAQHSAKPEEVARRIERLYGGPYLELFARRPREGWTTWGNEL